MRKPKESIFAALWLMAAATAHGQTTEGGGAANYVRPALTIEERVVAPEPRPWAFPEYEAPQVDLSTGSGSMAVGLYSWNVGSHVMSVSLGYSLGGHTLEEKSGLVGVGWNLGCAGTVYRDIAGLPDEYKVFKSLTEKEIYDLEAKKAGEGLKYLNSLEDKSMDAMYDRYHYQFAGHSGSFMVKGGSIVMLPADNVTITRIGEEGEDGVKDFRIELPDGTIYEFCEREYSAYSYKPVSVSSSFKNPGYSKSVAKWHLSRIITPQGADTISYTYAAMPEWSVGTGQSSAAVGIVSQQNVSTYMQPDNDFPKNATSAISFIGGKILKSIRSRTATVEFSHKEFAELPAGPMMLAGFRVKNPEGTTVREVSLGYLDKAEGTKDRTYRRFLTEIRIESDGVLLDSHQFTYDLNGNANRPGDLFGYANGIGESDNRCVIDAQTADFNPKRKPSEHASYGTMTRHMRANGMTVEFSYEPNTIERRESDGSVQIGVRLKKITARDIFTGRYQTRTFSYSGGMCTHDFSRLDFSAFTAPGGFAWNVKSSFGTMTDLAYYNRSGTVLQSYRYQGAPLSAARIYYARAVEELTGSGIERAVRTEWEYDTTRCGLRFVRCGSSGSPSVFNIKRHIKVPAISRRENVLRLIEAGFCNNYFAECTFATPRLKARREMEWTGNGYEPLVEREYFYSLADSAAYSTGLFHELLVMDNTSTNGHAQKHSALSTEDYNYYRVGMVSGRWRVDSVSEKRHYRGAPVARVSQSSTAYKYTDRNFIYPGDDIIWATPGYDSFPIRPLAGDDSWTIPADSMKFIYLPTDLSRVFGDSIEARPTYEHMWGIVMHGGGHTAAHYTLHKDNIGRTKVHVPKIRVPKSVPVAEMWVVDGKDSLFRHTDFGIFHGLTRPTRVTLGIKGAPVMAEQRFTAYTPLGQPLDRFSPGKADERYAYSGDNLVSISVGPAERELVTRFTHAPLVGCTSITSPAAVKEEYGYEGGRLTWHKTGGSLMEEYAYDYHDGTASPNMVTVTDHAAGQPAVSRECFDGFGASIGTVKEDYGTGGSVLAATVHDAMGRVLRQWAGVPVGSIAEALRSESVLAQAAEEALGDARAYTESEYPVSAESDPERVTLAGTAFAGHAAVTEKVCSDPAVGELKVRRVSWDGAVLRCSGYYGAGELEGTRVSDADGVTVITLRDALGREVIRRALGADGTIADTYTVSDAWGSPLLVLQPMGSKYLVDGDVWNTAHPMMEGYAFIYRYDSRLRPVSIKVPGCAAELTAYDTMGRVAYTRNGDLAAFGRKRFYLYDEYSRPAASGICEDFLSEAEWDAEHPAQTLCRGALQGVTAEEYDWGAVTMPPAAKMTEVSYYDRYLPGTKPTVGIAAPLGMPTGERTAVMEFGFPGDSTVQVWHAYNALGQEIQTDETRPGGDRVLRSATYTIGGLPLQSNMLVSGTGKKTASLTVSTEYDAFGRVTQSRAVTNLGATVVLERNTYDAAGRLATTETNGGMTASFGYDVRGALTARKDSLMEMEYTYATGSVPSYAGRISGRKTRVRNGIGFDVTNHSYTYDAMGRLAEATLKQGQSVIGTKPSFPSLGAVTLAADSLTLGDIYPLNPVRPTLTFPADNSESFTYDLNANLLTISRKGKDDAGSYRVVDEIEMGYIGNQLSWLRDTAEDPLLEGSMDIPQGNYSGYDIMYDGAGRVTRDVSRGISHVNYNVTGTPFVVGTMTADCAVYGYTSSGTKLSETIYNGSVTTRRDYVGPCEYVDGKLVRINVPQGYIDSLGVLHAYIHDIQGNVAGVYEAKAGKKQLEQLNEYYAYGGLTADSKGQDRNRYRHTGKELVSDLGINSYDFTARWQYPMAGAFTSPDAKATDYKWLSPYSFCGGDPINYTDPTGMDIYRFDQKTGEMHLYKVTDDDFDQIGDFKYNKKSGEYELKTDRKGEAKTLIDKVEKGILSDGLNMRENDTVWQVGGEGQPTVEGFQDFVIEFSELLGVELRGYYYATTGSDEVQYVRMGDYKNNTNRESYAGTSNIRFPYLINTTYLHTSWHTHPSNASDLARFNPSKIDKESKKHMSHIIKRFIILTKGHMPIHY